MKKLLSLILTLALLSTLLVFGGASASAVELTTEVTDGKFYATEHIRVVETGTAGTDTVEKSVTGHKVTYDSNSKSATNKTDTVAHGNTRLTSWVIFKFNIGEWESISAASLTVRAQTSNSTTFVYAYKATPADWNKAYAAAVTNGTDNVGTLDTDNLLTTPITGTGNPRISLTASTEKTATLTAANNASSAQFDSILAYLKDPANIDADGNVYLGVSVYRRANASGYVYNTNSADYCPYLTITGSKIAIDPNLAFKDADASVEIKDTTATVTTNAGKGSAKLIAASYIGNEMVDVMMRTLSAADAEKGKLNVDISSLSTGLRKVFLLTEDTLVPLCPAAEDPTYQEAFNALKSTLTSNGTEFSTGNFGVRRDFAENGSTAFISYNTADDRIVISYYSEEKTSSVSLVLHNENAGVAPMVVVSAEETAAFGAQYIDKKISVFHNETTEGSKDMVNRAVSNFVKASDLILEDMETNVELRHFGILKTENIADSTVSVENPDEEKTVLAENILTAQSTNCELLADVAQIDAASTELAAAIKGIPYFIPLASNSGPVVILKADDLSTSSYTTFKKMYNMLQEEKITNASFGIIGNRCTGDGTEDLWTFIEESVDNGAEIWHHGWSHELGGDTDSEFSGLYTYDEMKTRVGDTIDLVKENTGYQITTMGAPGNKVNAEFATMLNAEFPEIDKIFFSKGYSFNAHALNTAIYPESGTNGVTFSHFMEVYNPDHTYTVIQFHPLRLKAYSLWDDFTKMIQYLRSQNCQFMTPTQYVNSLESED